MRCNVWEGTRKFDGVKDWNGEKGFSSCANGVDGMKFKVKALIVSIIFSAIVLCRFRIKNILC